MKVNEMIDSQSDLGLELTIFWEGIYQKVASEQKWFEEKNGFMDVSQLEKVSIVDDKFHQETGVIIESAPDADDPFGEMVVTDVEKLFRWRMERE